MMEDFMTDEVCRADGGVSPLPNDPVVAMAYVPFQQFGSVYPSEKALDAGTLFPDLDKPFYGRRRAPR